MSNSSIDTFTEGITRLLNETIFPTLVASLREKKDIEITREELREMCGAPAPSAASTKYISTATAATTKKSSASKAQAPKCTAQLVKGGECGRTAKALPDGSYPDPPRCGVHNKGTKKTEAKGEKPKKKGLSTPSEDSSGKRNVKLASHPEFKGYKIEKLAEDDDRDPFVFKMQGTADVKVIGVERDGKIHKLSSEEEELAGKLGYDCLDDELPGKASKKSASHLDTDDEISDGDDDDNAPAAAPADSESESEEEKPVVSTSKPPARSNGLRLRH